MASSAFDFVALTLQIAGVLDLHLYLRGYVTARHRWPEPAHCRERGVTDFRPPQQLGCVRLVTYGNPEVVRDGRAQRVRRGSPQRVQALQLKLDGIALRTHGVVALRGHHPQLEAGLAQAQIGVVLAQVQAVFGARGEHAVRLERTVGSEVIDQHTNVRLVPSRVPRSLSKNRTRGVQAGDQTLCGCFLVAGGAVDLAGEIQAAERFGFQPRVQSARVKEVVLDGVARPRDMRMLEALD